MSTPVPIKRHFHTCPNLRADSADSQNVRALDHSVVADSIKKICTISNEEQQDNSMSSAKAELSQKMKEKYQIIKPLDKGSFGEVSLATLANPAGTHSGTGTASVTTCTGPSLRRSSTEVFVIKKIDKEKANDVLISNEIEAGYKLTEHPAIPKFVETYTDDRYCYMVFEYFNGLNLYNYLEARNFKPVKEHHSKRILRQIVDALIYCHNANVCHRDLKLENIMYNPKRKVAKLIDFGLCAINQISCADMCNNWCGSPDYVCPEILIQQHYSGCLSDVWSLGIILYVLLFGQMPFNFKERYYALQHNEPHPALNFPSDKDLPYKVSDSAKDLIKKMLAVDPRQRISMEEVPQHKWIQKKSANLLSLFGIKSHEHAYHKGDQRSKDKEQHHVTNGKQIMQQTTGNDEHVHQEISLPPQVQM